MSLAPRHAFACLFALIFLQMPSAVAFTGNPAGEQLIFTGAQAAGTTALTFSNNVYSFTFQGDETITYSLDLSLAKVAGGMLRIKETSSNCYPVDGCGVIFSDATSKFFFPKDLYQKTTLLGHSASGNTLTLDYQLDFNGLHPYRFEITQLKKQLRIRALDPTGNLTVANNFSGMVFGDSTGVDDPRRIQMQGALAQPITLFENLVPGAKLHFFVANALDLFQSNASDYDSLSLVTPGYGASTVTTAITTAGRYHPLSDGKLAAPLDDAYLVIVSSKIKDVLLTSTAPPSPYLGLLANRMVVNAPEKVWSWYDSMFDTYAFFGMENLVTYFFEWSDGKVDPPAVANVGPDWSPAVDPGAFQALLAKGRTYGHLVGAYSAFNCAPTNAGPGNYNPAEIVKTATGQAKLYNQLGFPLLGVEASAGHVATEIGKLKDLGANAAYLDIQTYGSLSQAPDGDHLDQQAQSPWAKTHRQGFAAQKTWMENMRALMQGPLLGEGSIGTIKTNMEFLWIGYVDSVQRVINTASGQNASQLPFNSPFAPTNWQVIPEYEWRVAARTQVNHGNGFYDRFFGKTDGPTIVDMNTGLPLGPLSQDALDLYQAFLITYGHAGYITTNGIQSGTEGYLTHAAAAQTYFMTNALQWRYFSSPVQLIRYRHNGSWKNFEPILFETESTGTFQHIPVVMQFANGLRMYINHGLTPLNINEGGVTYTLPAKTGWWAGDGLTLLSFSAIAPTTGGQRIDYCRALGQYEYFNGRGVVEGYGSLTTPHKLSTWIVNSTNLTITEDPYGNFLPEQRAPPPALTMINLYFDGLTLGVGQRIGLRAFAFFDNYSIRDVTTLMSWNSTKPWVATVNAAGVFEAVSPGTTMIHAVTTAGTALAVPITLTVQ